MPLEVMQCRTLKNNHGKTYADGGMIKSLVNTPILPKDLSCTTRNHQKFENKKNKGFEITNIFFSNAFQTKSITSMSSFFQTQVPLKIGDILSSNT